MSKGHFRERYDTLLKTVEARLGQFFTESLTQAELFSAMRYSLLAGGKRVRPIITLAFCAASGGDLALALDPACAVEMLHTYSLIHDDLPCMDDDDLRRGKPTNHIVYGECTATLAGDALQAAAFETILKSDLPPERVVAMAKRLARAAGAYGMCGGQVLDMTAAGHAITESELTEIHTLKTASLLIAAAEIGVLAAGGTAQQAAAARAYATALGKAFQIRDDILDMTASTDQLGKKAGSDAENNKSTYARLFGIPRCEELIAEETRRAVSAVGGGLFSDTAFLEWLPNMLAERKY